MEWLARPRNVRSPVGHWDFCFVPNKLEVFYLSSLLLACCVGHLLSLVKPGNLANDPSSQPHGPSSPEQLDARFKSSGMAPAGLSVAAWHKVLISATTALA